jgi:D-glycero-D-manno-heptose 1,7-bisphosphate phosphatase
VLNRKLRDGEYVASWAQFEWLPGAIDGVALLNARGVRVIVVTNQRGIALGRMTEADLAEIHTRMETELARAGAWVDAIYHCPHDVGECDCRKPATGLFERAARELGDIDLHRSVMIGDSDSDIEAAARIGAASVWIGAPPTASHRSVRVDHCAPTLLDAARWLVDGR